MFNDLMKAIDDDIANDTKLLEKQINQYLQETTKLIKEKEELQQRIDKAEECISNFLCTEEYINVDGKAIANNYEKILKILKGDSNE